MKTFHFFPQSINTQVISSLKHTHTQKKIRAPFNTNTPLHPNLLSLSCFLSPSKHRTTKPITHNSPHLTPTHTRPHLSAMKAGSRSGKTTGGAAVVDTAVNDHNTPRFRDLCDNRCHHHRLVVAR
ncbi:hypothetical protein Hdeb2414_s0001g00019701 [Helianthus debilis subsp. tardiflorus]